MFSFFNSKSKQMAEAARSKRLAECAHVIVQQDEKITELQETIAELRDEAVEYRDELLKSKDTADAALICIKALQEEIARLKVPATQPIDVPASPVLSIWHQVVPRSGEDDCLRSSADGYATQDTQGGKSHAPPAA